jgi:hypothetical protein
MPFILYPPKNDQQSKSTAIPFINPIKPTPAFGDKKHSLKILKVLNFILLDALIKGYSRFKK